MTDFIAAGGENTDAVLAEHRNRLWLLGIRAIVVRATSAHQCRRSRWQAWQARRLLQQRVVRGVVTKDAPRRRKSGRRRSRARLVVVTKA